MAAILSNPYVIAALIGTGVYFGLQKMKPAMLDAYPFATPMNVGIFAAVLYLAYMYYNGSLGSRSMLSLSAAPSAAARVTTRGASTIADLLGPDQF